MSRIPFIWGKDVKATRVYIMTPTEYKPDLVLHEFVSRARALGGAAVVPSFQPGTMVYRYDAEDKEVDCYMVEIFLPNAKLDSIKAFVEQLCAQWSFSGIIVWPDGAVAEV